MDYRVLAEELLALGAQLSHVPANQQLSALMRGELFVLNYLMAHNNTAYPKELSQQMAVSTARIAALLGQMEEKGLVCRTPDTQDARHIIVSLTQKGLGEIKRKRELTVETVAKMLELLGPEDAKEYLRLQAELIQDSTFAP